MFYTWEMAELSAIRAAEIRLDCLNEELEQMLASDNQKGRTHFQLRVMLLVELTRTERQAILRMKQEAGYSDSSGGTTSR